MHESEDFSVKEGSGPVPDQVDGGGMSLGRKKGVRVSGKLQTPPSWERGGQPVMHSYVGGPGPPDRPVSISPPLLHRCPGAPGRDYAQDNAEDNNPPLLREEWGRDCTDTGITKQTMEELKSILKENTRGREEVRPAGPGGYTYLHGTRSDPGRPDDGGQNRSFSTFKPQPESSSRRGPRSGETAGSAALHLGSGVDSSSSSCRVDGTAKKQSDVWPPASESSVSWDEARSSQTDNGKENSHHTGNQNFLTVMEQIKQQIARENINFVRFEATDLHGVSRSKTVPVRFFQEKAVYGVPMPRSYLELTVSSKSSEVDNASTANFSSDVLLIPDLSTFRVLPWAEQTSRVICDPCTVTGSPLRTSPRLLAKQLLGQLQSLGFSLHSSFTYECCVLGAPERVGPKTLMFPATTLLSNHDLPFFQQLVDGMYCMGADVDSFASAIGPGQMEINLRPEFGIAAADSAFTFRTGIKEMARKHSYVASFFADDGLHNAGVLSHGLWDANGRRSLFHAGDGRRGEMSEIGRKWLAGLLNHSAALSCLMSPGVGCRSHIAKMAKDPKHAALYASCGFNDNSSSFNVKCHGGREMYIDNKLGSAMANPYVVLAATVAAGLDGIKRNLNVDLGVNRGLSQRQYAIPVKLLDALGALEEDHVIRNALGEPFVQYFIAMKRFEIETQELDEERNKCLEYFI